VHPIVLDDRRNVSIHEIAHAFENRSLAFIEYVGNSVKVAVRRGWTVISFLRQGLSHVHQGPPEVIASKNFGAAEQRAGQLLGFLSFSDDCIWPANAPNMFGGHSVPAPESQLRAIPSGENFCMSATTRFSTSASQAACSGRRSGKPKNSLASVGVQSTLIVIFTL
jgi:hypothetical protein